MNNGIKRILLEIAKLAVLVLLVIFVISLSDTGKLSSTEFSVMTQKVTAAADLQPMTEGDNQMVRRLYRLEPAEFDGITLYYPSDSMDACELMLVKLKDVSQQKQVKDALQARVDGQLAVFESYAPECVALLKKSILRVEGNYALLIVAEDPAKVAQAFTDGL